MGAKSSIGGATAGSIGCVIIGFEKPENHAIPDEVPLALG